ncbi:MAG: c-type cytochrome [Hyphomicrobiaceae bacterium]|nr:MAG: c-type cytochrome [Hyphomicrobiaceae bacterium]
MRRCVAILLSLAAFAGCAAAQAQAPSGQELYREHCASCHGSDRLGQSGPALIPEGLGRLRRAQAIETVAKGRPATQMPPFRHTLSTEAISAVVDYIYTPLGESPAWGAAEIEATRVTHAPAGNVGRPVYDADPLNLFVVVEAGDHHITILDGDRFEPIHRFKSRFALHGGPKFTGDGRHVFFASRDGWITKFDLWRLEVVAEVRAGINTRNIALSSDGKYLAVANYLPASLVLLSADDLAVKKIFDVRDRKGLPSRVSAVYYAAPRNSFIAALKDVAEIWEIATDPDAPPVYTGLVHSHERGMTEALASTAGLFSLRRIEIDEPLDDFFFDPPYRHVLGSSRDGKSAVVVNLNVGRPIARIDIPGMPHLGAGISWERDGRRVLATPHLKESKLSVIDMESWRVVGRIETLGPGFFLRSHESSRYAWTDVMLGPAKDSMHVIDKTTLEIVRTLRPVPGKTAAHVEFDRTGRHALVSVWEMDGAIVVYDAATLEEVKRIPMSKPSGKYNVYNKIMLSEGTSH